MEIARTGIQLREPNPVMKGGGTVPNNTSSNMIARAAGNAYASDFFNYQPLVEVASAGCATLLNDNVTFPKKIRCDPLPLPPSHHIVKPFDRRIRFGMRKNTKKPVIAAQNWTTTNNTGQCAIATVY